MNASLPFLVGDCFLHFEKQTHLWIVLSSPEIDSDRILLVNVTSAVNIPKATCKLSVGTHPFIVKPSCVNFADARIKSLSWLISLEASGKLLRQDPLSERIYKFVFEMALLSPLTPYHASEMLEEQGVAKPYRQDNSG